jgi:hypothetical protein
VGNEKYQSTTSLRGLLIEAGKKVSGHDFTSWRIERSSKEKYQGTTLVVPNRQEKRTGASAPAEI